MPTTQSVAPKTAWGKIKEVAAIAALNVPYLARSIPVSSGYAAREKGSTFNILAGGIVPNVKFSEQIAAVREGNLQKAKEQYRLNEITTQENLVQSGFINRDQANLNLAAAGITSPTQKEVDKIKPPLWILKAPLGLLLVI